MIPIPVCKYTDEQDLLLADGSVVYMDGTSRWHVVLPDGTQKYLGRRRAFIPESNDGGYCYDSYASRPDNVERRLAYLSQASRRGV
jgi:hypothetical protein